MANVTSVLNSIANHLGVSMTTNKDSIIKSTEDKHTLGSIFAGKNLVITEGAAGKVLGEQLIESVKDMMNSAPANAAGLMSILKSMAEVAMSIAKNMAPNEELQEKIKERLEELKELADRLKEDDQNYEAVLARFKEIFIDTDTENILEKRQAEEHPIQA